MHWLMPQQQFLMIHTRIESTKSSTQTKPRLESILRSAEI